ncbi:MAG TPA: DUF885 family protein [Candidatus Babeliales bacterium]|nr:DUF885 family protein [Candidatus Babeliales bacterium]
MNRLFTLMTALSFNVLLIGNHPISRSIDSNTLFSDNPHPDLYWKALTQMAKNNKEAALNIVKALRSGSEESITALQTQTSDTIDAVFDHLFITAVSRNPQLLSQLRIFESIGVREHNAYLNDVSPTAIAQECADKKANLQLLQQFSCDQLSQHDRTSYQIFNWMLNHAAEGEKFIFHEYRINQLFGVLTDLSIVFTQYHPLETAEDVHHYIARLTRIPAQLDQTIALLEHQKNHAIHTPQFTLEKVTASLTTLLSEQAQNSIFYTHLAEQLKHIDVQDKQALLEKTETIIQTMVYPSFAKLQHYCKQLLDGTAFNHGAWALPDGDAYYAHALARHTTTTLTADEIHELGLIEVQKIHQQMRKILHEEGISDPNKSISELVRELEKDERFYFPQTEEGRKQCIARFEAIIERCRKELYPLFDLKPKAPVRIQAVPKHEEEGQPGAYYSAPSMDGSLPGTFFINLRNMDEIPTFRMETLAIHEAEPGHHFQIALQQEMDIPILRKLGEFNAFVEGWALYTEKLAYEQNFYSSNFDKLGHLQDELLRAVRLVIDTGIHKKRWTREHAIEYMMRETGFHRDSVVTEVERYFVLPGQACSYKIGQLKFLELRKRAQDALGNKFDIREFHNTVLKIGACPLTILEQAVDEYIEQTNRS